MSENAAGAEVRIRPARAEDAPELARLRYRFRAGLAAAAESEGRFIERCRRWMAERLTGDGWRCWIAEGDGRVVGTVWLGLIEKLPNPVDEAERHGYVTNLFVEESCRGCGTGSALLGTALREGERLRCDAILLWPTPRSRTLYRRHGFEVSDALLVRRGRPQGLAVPDPDG